MRIAVAALAVASLAAGAAVARAQPGTVAVIEPGREREVMDLFEPYGLGGEVTPGFRIMDLRIEQTRIVARVEGPDGAQAVVTLEHPEAASGPEIRTESFAIGWEADGEGAGGAARRLAEAVRRNDRGHFWRVRARPAPRPGDALRRDGGTPAWLLDGSVWLLAALLLLQAMVGRHLRDAPRYTGAWLVAIVLAGAGYRLWLAPETMLGAWPYSRMVPLVRRVWEGPALATLSGALDAPIEYFDFVTTLTLLFALVTPLAVFVHARTLLGDVRTGLLAAAVVAALPVHVRFSHSEVEFIHSLALSSLTFAAIHTAVRDESGGWRALAMVAVPLLAAATFVTRPLNVLFLPLFLFAAFALHRDAPAPRARRMLVAALLVASGALAIALHFVHHYAEEVREGSHPVLLMRALEALFSLRLNTLVHPGITPPGLLLFAVLGAVWTWRRDRRLAVFLLAWLVAFFVTHAYVLPRQSAMQARYHLHLVAPFALLAALGLATLLRRNARAGAVALLYVAVSPVVHSDFVTDVAFDDLREYRFLRDAREHVPAGCMVLEHAGPGGNDARWARLGAVLDGFAERRRWKVVPIAAPPDSDEPLRPAARGALERPGGCVVYYQGLPCWSEREEGEPIARACAAVAREVPLDPLATDRFESRTYDDNLHPGEDVREVSLALYWIRRPRPR